MMLISGNSHSLVLKRNSGVVGQDLIWTLCQPIMV